jgi:integrase
MQAVPGRYPANHGTAADLILGEKSAIAKTTVPPHRLFSQAKIELDEAMADIREQEGRDPVAPWVLHDLRRTGRSLMSRAKVPFDHAERSMGHAMGGVREIYDRYSYLDEKRAAFEALATTVSSIVKGKST